MRARNCAGVSGIGSINCAVSFSRIARELDRFGDQRTNTFGHDVGDSRRCNESAPGVGLDVDAGFLQRRNSGQQRRALGGGHGKDLDFAGGDLRHHRNRRQADHLHVIADQRRHRLRRRGIGDVDELRAAFQRDRRHGELRQRAGADRAVGIFAGIVRDQIEQFPRRVHAEAGIDRKRARLRHQHGDEREIFFRIVRQIAEQQRIDGKRPADADADGRAVRRGLGYGVGAGIAAGARLVFDDERHLALVVQVIGDGAGDDIGRRAGAEWHDEPHRPGRPLLCACRGRAKQNGQCRQHGALHRFPSAFPLRLARRIMPATEVEAEVEWCAPRRNCGLC